MASWITDEYGKWHPAKEIASLVNRSNKAIEIEMTDGEGKKFKKKINPGEPYIYEGPDRAALFELWELDKTGKTTTLGSDFRQNPEFLESYAKARNAFGFNSVDEYLMYLNYDFKKVKEDFDKKASIITKHELSARIAEIKRIGGGSDLANPGKNIKYGGFGEPEELSVAKNK